MTMAYIVTVGFLYTATEQENSMTVRMAYMVTIGFLIIYTPYYFVDLIYGRVFEFLFFTLSQFRVNIDKSKLLCPTLDIFRYI